jgi:phosphoribosylanthranilate isomerase
LEAARTLGQRTQGRAGKVALTVDANDDTLLDIIAALKPDMLQLHGSETPDRVVAVRTRFGLPVMKALPIAERKDLSPIRQYAQFVDRLIFDARAHKEANRPGGLCKPFDWTLLQDIKAGVPFMLSGGLDPTTSWKRCARHAPGVMYPRCRARARRKGSDKIRAFIRARGWPRLSFSPPLQLGETSIVRSVK